MLPYYCNVGVPFKSKNDGAFPFDGTEVLAELFAADLRYELRNWFADPVTADPYDDGIEPSAKFDGLYPKSRLLPDVLPP